MALQEFSGNAVAATLNGTITSGATSCVISDGTGWPTGATAPFVATFGKGTATEEKILCSTRSGTTLNFATRGYDGTSPAAHSSGDTVIHSISAAVVAEASAHVNTTTRDDHTQYAKKASNLSDLSNVTTARTNLGIGTMGAQAASAVAITGGTIAGITDLAVADGGTGASTAANARTNLGVVIGTNVQAWDTDLDALAGLTYAADKLPYFTGAHAAATTTLTSFIRTLLDDADAATALTTLYGSNPLAAWTSYTPTNQSITVGNGTQSAAYRLIGKTCIVRYRLLLGSTSAIDSSGPAFGLPFAASVDQVGTAFGKSTGGSTRSGPCAVLLDDSATLAQLSDADGVRWSALAPWTWATGYRIVAQITYETT